MPKQKSDRLLEAVKKCITNEISIREAARRYNVSRLSITRLLSKCKKSDFIKSEEMFTQKEERLLKEHLMVAGRLHYGLTKRYVQDFVYEWAKLLFKIYPPKWDEKGFAGEDWVDKYIERNPDVLFTYEECTSDDQIGLFFENYHKLCVTTNVPIENIWNCHEHFIGDNSSNGINLIVAISASGQHIPPMMVLPLEKYTNTKFKESFISSIYGASPHPEKLNYKLFLNFLKHFKEHTKCTTENPVILLLDDNNCHISIEIIQLAVSSGILLITVPRIPNKKLQPLDNLFSLLKQLYDSKLEKVSKIKDVTFQNIIELVELAFEECFNEDIIQQCFEVTGIFPLNETLVNTDDKKDDIFEEDVF